jgi:DNA-binding MarR family transcriptional regulator
MEQPDAIRKQDYEQLAAFRYGLRTFLRFSESAARRQGLTPQPHQLLLAVKGFPGRDYANISELGERLQLTHHSVVGIVDRSERAGLVYRENAPTDHRTVYVRLSPPGEPVLASLTLAHREELARLSQYL